MKRLFYVAIATLTMACAQICYAQCCGDCGTKGPNETVGNCCSDDYTLDYHADYKPLVKPKARCHLCDRHGCMKCDHYDPYKHEKARRCPQADPEVYRLQYQSRYCKHGEDDTKQSNKVHRKKGLVTMSPQFKIVYKDRIASFKNLIADGNTIVVVDKNQPKNTIKFVTKTIYPTKLIDYKVDHGTLYLSRFTKRNWDKVAQQAVYVYVNTNQLDNITLSRGAGLFTSSIQSAHSKIRLKDFGKIRLRGTFDINELMVEGSGDLSIEWIKSHRLRLIQTGTAKVHLAGEVNVLNVRAIDAAKVDAQFLRAKNAVVQTADYATVKVTAINALSAFASDFSNILYYKTPLHLSRHNYASGNVLQMRHWN